MSDSDLDWATSSELRFGIGEKTCWSCHRETPCLLYGSQALCLQCILNRFQGFELNRVLSDLPTPPNDIPASNPQTRDKAAERIEYIRKRVSEYRRIGVIVRAMEASSDSQSVSTQSLQSYYKAMERWLGSVVPELLDEIDWLHRKLASTNNKFIEIIQKLQLEGGRERKTIEEKYVKEIVRLSEELAQVRKDLAECKGC